MTGGDVPRQGASPTPGSVSSVGSSDLRWAALQDVESRCPSAPTITGYRRESPGGTMALWAGRTRRRHVSRNHAGAALGDSADDRLRRRIDVGDCMKIELEVRWLRHEGRPACAFQASHIRAGETAADNDTQDFLLLDGTEAVPTGCTRCASCATVARGRLAAPRVPTARASSSTPQ